MVTTFDRYHSTTSNFARINDNVDEVYKQSNYRLRQEIGLWIGSVALVSTTVYNLLQFIIVCCGFVCFFHGHIKKCVSYRTTIMQKLPFYIAIVCDLKQQQSFHQIDVCGYNIIRGSYYFHRCG